MTIPPTDEITADEARVILGLKRVSSISRYVRDGKLIASRKLPGDTGARLFWRHDVIRLAAERNAEQVA